MKNIYAFMAAALMSASLFAAVPTEADLAAAYDVNSNVVICFQPIDDATVCSDIYFVGSPNNWAKYEGTEDFANCHKFSQVAGFDGWYAVELPYSDGMSGKPVHNTQDGKFSMDYQCGDPDAWVYVGGHQITLNLENGNESSMGYTSAGVYIYQLKYWKAHKNPCEVISDIIVKAKFPAEGCPDNVEITGTFDSWTGTAMTFNASTGYFEAVVSATSSDEFNFRSGIGETSDDKWAVRLQIYTPAAEESAEGTWANMANMAFSDYLNEDVIEIDFTAIEGVQVRWTPSELGIENVVLTEKAHKVVVDGVLYIVRDNKMYNAQGTQVR